MNNGKQPITPSMWTKCGEGADDYQPLKDGQETGWETKFGGLTKREYFSAKAMQGFMSNPTEAKTTTTHVFEILGLNKETKYSFKDHYFKYVAQISVSYADALIEQLNVEATNMSKL